jgi:DNA-binding XRE family transcriptional regulator
MAKRRKLKPTKLLQRWIDVQAALGWSNEQMAAEIGVTRNCWASWSRGDYRPGNKYQIILESKIERLEDVATKPKTEQPKPPALPAPKTEKQARRTFVSIDSVTLKRIADSIVISNDPNDNGVVKLIVVGRVVVGAEYVQKISV